MRLQKRRVQGLAVRGLGITAIAVLGATGCGAGQITQTSTQQAAVNGAYAQVGSLFIRDAALKNRDSCEQAYAQGMNASLRLQVVSGGQKDDELVSVTSDASAGAIVDGAKTVVAQRALIIGFGTGEVLPGQPASSAPASATSSSASSATSTSPTAASSAKPSSTGATPSATVSSQSAAPAIGQGSVVLQGLKRAVWPGQTVPVTFVFRDAGAVTVELPVAAPASPLNCKLEGTTPADGHSEGHSESTVEPGTGGVTGTVEGH